MSDAHLVVAAEGPHPHHDCGDDDHRRDDDA
jgi:hypothetical protein